MEVSNVLVTASGTIAWSAIVATIMDPGEEIIVLAPNWPLAAGAIRTCKGTPRQVSFMGVHDPETAIALVAPHLTERTVALYLNTPNNPTGEVLTRPVLKALVSPMLAEHRPAPEPMTPQLDALLDALTPLDQALYRRASALFAERLAVLG